MKTPASILGILGRFLAVLCLTGTTMAEANPPANPAPKAAVALPADGGGQSSAVEGLPMATTPRLSPWTKEIVKLAQSGIEESVMIAFMDNSGSFELGADQIVYLNDIGLPASVIAAMLQHDRELASGERLLTIVSEPPYEPVFTLKPVPSSQAAAKPVNPPAPLPPTLPEPPAMTAPAEPQALQLASNGSLETTSTFASAPPLQVSDAKRPLYPVREPRTVELLPPIVFLNTAEVAPNTLIVYGFPKP